MFNTRTVLLATAVGAVVAGLLIVLIGAPLAVACFTGAAAGAIAAVIPWAVREGRFPGLHSKRPARRVLSLGSAVVLGSSLIGLATLNVDRTTRFSLQLLVLAVGTAGLVLGSAAALLDTDQGASRSENEPRGI